MEHKDEGEEMTVRNFFQCTAKIILLQNQRDSEKSSAITKLRYNTIQNITIVYLPRIVY